MIAAVRLSTFLAVLCAPLTGLRLAGVVATDVFVYIALFLSVIEFFSHRAGQLTASRWTGLLAPLFVFLVIAVWSLVSSRAVDSLNAGTVNTSIAGFSAFAGQSGAPLTFVRIVTAMTALPLLVAGQVWRDGAVAANRLFRGFVFGAAVSAGIAILQAVAGIDLGTFVYSATVNTYQPGVATRVSGLAFHPNSLAAACAVALPFAIMAIEVSRSIIGRVGWVVAAAVIIAGIAYSGSRGGILAGLVAGAAALLFALRGKRAVALPPVLLLMIAVILTAGPAILERTRFGAEAAGSDAGRALARDYALTLFNLNPLLGSGLSNIGSGVSVVFGLLAATGIVGFVAYYILIVIGITRLWRYRQDAAVLCYASVASLLTVVAIGIFENSVAERYEYVALGVAWGLQRVRAGGQPQHHKHDTFKPTELSRYPRGSILYPRTPATPPAGPVDQHP